MSAASTSRVPEPRVLVVTSNLAGPGRDGFSAAGYACRLVLEEIGHQVGGVVLAPRAHGAPDTESMGRLEVQRVGPPRPRESFTDALRRGRPGPMVTASTALRQAVRARSLAERFDLVHAWWALPAGWAAGAAAGGPAFVLSTPGSDLHAWAGRAVVGQPFRRVIGRADVVVVPGDEGIEQAGPAGARRAVAIPTCYDPEIFRLVPEVPERPVIAYVGRVTRAKGLFVLADALRTVREQVPDAELVVCGDGADRAAAERALNAALPGRVRCLGAVAPSVVAAELGRARVVVLPSFGEGLAATVLEALAVGRPVVSTMAGSHARVVGAGGGTVVATGDAGALAAGLVAELAADRAPAALNRLARPFTPRQVAAQYLDVYAQAGYPALAALGRRRRRSTASTIGRSA